MGGAPAPPASGAALGGVEPGPPASPLKASPLGCSALARAGPGAACIARYPPYVIAADAISPSQIPILMPAEAWKPPKLALAVGWWMMRERIRIVGTGPSTATVRAGGTGRPNFR